MGVKCMKKVVKRGALSLGVIAIMVMAAWYFINLFEYSLRASVKADGALQIQTLFLGEYYTPVTLLEIQESNTGNRVVTLLAKSENSRMHTVTIRKGVNLFNDVYLDGYVVNYMSGNQYSFIAGKRYTARVEWGVFTKEVSFVLSNGT